MKPKWRGIKTSQIAKYENEPLTTYNRFGQKSISLPRIDDKKRWAGFAGITGISRKLAYLLPKCTVYVEPFAGTAKVWQELQKQNPQKYFTAVLNDRSRFVFKWLVKEFNGMATIHNSDFAKIIQQYDHKTTLNVLDPPWNKSFYDQTFSCFDRESVRQYDEEVLKICKSIEGKFVITTSKANTIMRKSEFDSYLIESEYVLSGHYPLQMLTTNIKFDKRKIRKLGLQKIG